MTTPTRPGPGWVHRVTPGGPVTICYDCGRVAGHGHADGCRHPGAPLDRADVQPAWLSPASYRATTEQLHVARGEQDGVPWQLAVSEWERHDDDARVRGRLAAAEWERELDERERRPLARVDGRVEYRPGPLGTVRYRQRLALVAAVAATVAVFIVALLLYQQALA